MAEGETDRKQLREELEARCTGYAAAFSEVVPEGVGFAIFLFDYGEKGSVAYCSKAERADVLTLIKAWVEREERKAAG